MIILDESLTDYIFLSRCIPLPLSALKVIKSRVSFQNVLKLTLNQFETLLESFKKVDHISIRQINKKVENFNNLNNEKTFENIRKQLSKCDKNNIQCLIYFDKDFPPILKAIGKPPKLIFIQGTIKSEDYKAVAIIGTRNPTKYGEKMARDIAKRLVEEGFTIVSGFARGIDTIAMKGALDCGGRAIGVIASGILNLYPKEHQYLVEKLVSNGALISERFPHKNVTKQALQIRNRITSGFGLGNIFVEGNERSGTRWQYKFGARQGRPAFAVEPIDNDVEQAFIPNWIVNEKGGAKISSLQDIDWVIEMLNDEYEKRMEVKNLNKGTRTHQKSILKY